MQPVPNLELVESQLMKNEILDNFVWFILKLHHWKLTIMDAIK